MPRRPKRALPPQVAEGHDAIGDLLGAVAEGEEVQWESLVEALARTLRSARALVPDDEAGDYPRVVTFGQRVAEEVRRAREDAGWTQAQLADAMREAGHAWSRVAVAEVEAQSRRVSLEELLALAVLFGLPMVRFLLPRPGDCMELSADTRFYRTLDDSAVSEMFLGPGSRLAPVDGAWERPAHVAKVRPGEPDWRPAPQLWRNRDQVGEIVAGSAGDVDDETMAALRREADDEEATQ